MKTALVTGSNGFIGGHFKSALENWGKLHYKVVSGDRLGNVEGKPKIIIDCASYGNMHDQQDPELIYQSNVTRLVKLLQNSNSIDYKAFVIIGSSSEYGEVHIPMHEEMNPRPTTFYGASKVAAVMLGRAWYHEMHKPLVMVRPFTVVGPGEQESHLIPRLIRSCLHGEEMDFVPDAKHDFIDVRDFVSGVMKVIEKIKRTQGEVVNIGTGKQHTNQEVREIVEKLTGKKAHVKVVESLRRYDSKDWVADNFRLTSLGWIQQYSLEDTIEDMLKI